MNLDCGPCTVRDWRESDREPLVRYANNRNVWQNVGDRFPHPYTDRDADEWITTLTEQSDPTHWAIDIDGDAVGGVGIDIGEGELRKTAEFGYWLGEEFWGRGIMSRVVSNVAEFVLERYDLVRLQAPVFEWNHASMRVLEKGGFVREGILRKGACKDGRIIDTMLYARTV